MVDTTVNLWLTDCVKHIEDAQRGLESARDQLRTAVLQARSNGHTWAEIGATLGMSRQAAFKRFAEVTNPATGKKITGAPLSIAQLTTLTERTFDLISSAHYDELETLMHPDVRPQLPSNLMAETWQRVLTDMGEKSAYSDTHVVFPAGERIAEDEQLLGAVVGVTTIECEAGEVMGRVAFDDQQQIIGLLLVATDHGPLPF